MDGDGGKIEPPATLLSAVEEISNARKYLVGLYVENKMMTVMYLYKPALTLIKCTTEHILQSY
jgi:hypothetical protein